MFSFLRRAKKPGKVTPLEFATCERSGATETSPLHLRYLRGAAVDELVKTGGLRLRGVTAACGAEVAWDRRMVSRQDVVDALPNQNDILPYCKDCLDFTGIAAHV